MSTARAAAAYADEAAMARRWGDGVHGAPRLEDGRALRVVFPGVPGGGAGPDFRGAILDAGGDLLRGDIELHLRASGWRAHGHHVDPAYGQVALHVVAENDTGALTTLHGSGRAIAVLVLPAARQGVFPPPFTPPCVLQVARGRDAGAVLERLGMRRLRMKAARVAPLVRDAGAGQALYALLLETLGGTANREPFAALARRLPLAALLERLDESGAERALAAQAELKGSAAALTLRRAGLRPMASPAQRLEAAGALVAGWWPRGSAPAWPARLPVGSAVPRPLPAGVGRGSAIELAVNAVLPVALAAGAWPEAEIEHAWRTLPSPGTYGKLRRLEGWLGGGAERPFASAARLQGAILLQAEQCTRGGCGRCPMSEG
jgi:hypothetical protein